MLLTFNKLPVVIKIFVLSLLSGRFTEVSLYSVTNFVKSLIQHLTG